MYLYTDFVEDLKLGSEIEFSYKDIPYFVFYDDRGTVLINLKDKITHIFENDDDFLDSQIFESKILQQVWDDINIDTVL